MRQRLSKARSEAGLVLSVLRRVFAEQWKASPALVVSSLIFVPITAAMPLAASYVAGLALNKLTTSIGDLSQAGAVVWLFAAAALIGMAQLSIQPIENLIRQNATIKLQLFLRERMNRHTLATDLVVLESSHFSELFNKTVYRHEFAHERITGEIFRMSTNLLRALGAAAIVAALAWWMLPVLILAVIPSVITSFYIGRLRDMIWEDPTNLRSKESRTTNYIRSESTNIEMRLLGAQEYFLRLSKNLSRLFADKELGVNRRDAWLSTGSTIFADVILLGIQIWLVLKVLTDRSFGIGTYTFYFQTVTSFSNSFNSIFRGTSRLYEDCLILRDHYELLDITPTIHNKRNATKLTGTRSPRIEFRNVQFSYPNSSNPVLENVSFTVEPGMHVGLVGENGAGKTTIVKLLARFYEAEDGQVLIDGHDVRDIDLDSWRDRLSGLMQHYGKYIYEVSTNIGIGRYQKMNDAARVRSAAVKADAAPIIERFPKKYDQPLATMFPGGIIPSGGEWQRIALARALFREAGVVILDEPTASVDAKAEYQIFKQLIERQKGVTTFIISHRFSTVRQADLILVLDKGRIIESGSHNELMAKPNGHYRRLFEMQAEGYR